MGLPNKQGKKTAMAQSRRHFPGREGCWVPTRKSLASMRCWAGEVVRDAMEAPGRPLLPVEDGSRGGIQIAGEPAWTVWQVPLSGSDSTPPTPLSHRGSRELQRGEQGPRGRGAAEIYTLSILNLGPVVLGPLRVDTFMRCLMQKLLHVYFGLHRHCLRGIGGFRGL